MIRQIAHFWFFHRSKLQKIFFVAGYVYPQPTLKDLESACRVEISRRHAIKIRKTAFVRKLFSPKHNTSSRAQKILFFKLFFHCDIRGFLIPICYSFARSNKLEFRMKHTSLKKKRAIYRSLNAPGRGIRVVADKFRFRKRSDHGLAKQPAHKPYFRAFFIRIYRKVPRRTYVSRDTCYTWNLSLRDVYREFP